MNIVIKGKKPLSEWSKRQLKEELKNYFMSYNLELLFMYDN